MVKADCAAGRRRHGGVRSGALVGRWAQTSGLLLWHLGQLWEAGGRVTGPRAPAPRNQETLSCLLPLPSTWLLPFGTVKRGHNRVPGEPLHVSPDYVSPSPYLLTKRDTLVESIPAGGWRSVEQKSPGLLRLAFSLGRFSEWGRSLDPPHSLPLVFPSCARGWDGACLSEKGVRLVLL